MNRTLILAATLALAACAVVDKPATNGTSAHAASGTYFCWRDRLVTEGDNLVCNWDANAGDACQAFHTRTPLSRASIASGPTDVKHCDNGQWLVKVTMR